MELARNLFLVLHLLGMASIIGGFLVQTRSERKVVQPAMLHGALTALVTGLLLTGLLEMGDGDVNHTKIGVKLVVVLVVTALAWRRRRAESISTGEWAAIGGLTILNVVLAVFW
ncbi:hypothetical protein [Cellulomonas carbonis]|uniref:Membrane protein n=1 Tax=Cellulomonas carbonis T26 TaxID=947969 RepID=A0A0A0BL56_9CELL|nr:hypothetical protein [Cellulomonas carbonis]KGM08696.1 membrane protein [Cellulomonas carbonis T26]GGC05574.1 hypothetical protein GCM10010972_18480 [Cellulomonas carbonis]